MKLAPAIALATCLPSVLPAGQAFGLWCNDDGDQLLIDDAGMRGGDHIACDWITPVTDAPEIRAGLHCKTLKLMDGQWVPIHEETYAFSARLTDPNHLSVAYADGRYAYSMTRCED